MAYLGVRVGKIGDVRLAPGRIVVGLDIDREIRLPKGVTAEVRRRSAIGEPYVALSPPPTGVAGPTLAAGDTIPLARTTVPLDYKKLFEGVGKLLNAVPPEDADTIVHELAVALDGRAPAIRRIVDDAHTLTGTLADNAELLDDLSVQLTRLTHTLAGKRGELASGISDLSTVTAALRESRTDLNAFLDQGPGVFAQLDAAVRTSRPGFSCLLTAAGLPHQPAFSAATERNVHHLLSIVPTALTLAGDISDRRGGTVYGKASFIFSVPGGPTPAEEYAGPLGPPTVPKVRSCPSRAPAPDPSPDSGPGPDSGPYPDGRHADASRPAERAGEQDTPEPSPESTTESPRAVAGNRAASGTPMDIAPLIAAIFLAVVVSGGIVGWIAAGRAARRREESP
ncbi:MCE family protein [Nonomuraea rubra]|uniref:MCE family protein n=1 Tax=Nonomuraea rubra TaxID=46180 RepID=UPI00361D999D